MSTFVSQFNPLLGKNEWVIQDENYDYHQEIARSAYADMLHDTERNQKYYAALKKAIKKKRDQNEPVNVLDIGTGTGLLSMMAATIGADSITACEAFTPMAECARKVIQKNGFHDKIHLIPKRSTEITVGVGKDMPQKANILVTEVFDTELIGEGALGTYSHALKNLLEPDCLVVPHSASIFVQIAQSALGRSWNELQPILIDDAPSVEVPPELQNCAGALTLHDLQLNQISLSDFHSISEPQKVFDFDFSGKKELLFNEKVVSKIEAKSNGSIDVIFMWWNLKMDIDGEILLSCAPYWAHPEGCEIQWRDHWMQAIYYPFQYITVKESEQITLTSCHDEYSLWFDVTTDKNPKHSDDIDRPVCTCGVHHTYGRTRLGMINDTERNQIYIKELKKVITKNTHCLSISDGSLLPFIAARLGAYKVYVLEPHESACHILQSFVEYNHLDDVITIIKKAPIDITPEECDSMQIDLVIGEPYFQPSILPWHNLHFWYVLSKLPVSLKYIPQSMKIYAVAMEFKDLSKIRSPVNFCEGFCLEEFNELIEDSSIRADQNVEAEPLWEYPGYALSERVEMISFDVSTVFSDTNIRYQKFLVLKRDGRCNGIAFWVEYKFGESIISTGMKMPESNSSENYVTWDRHTRQGVHLLKSPISVSCGTEIPVAITFNSKSGQIIMDFEKSSY